MANEKKLEDYLHLYPGCELRSSTGSVRLMSVIAEIPPCTNWGIAVLNGNQSYTTKLGDYKPVLRPLSDMKEEEVLKICSIVSPTIFGDFRYNKWKVTIEREWDSTQKNYTVVREGDSHSFEVDCIDGDIFLWEDHQYIDAPYMDFNYKFEYLKMGFDLFGLIDAGLAVDKTTLNPKQ